nr:craniofacial development protein 2-like [Syngnathus scovelli]
MNFRAWNVRTLMDSVTSDRPERRTAIIARELRRCRIDIAALSETRRAEEGHLKEEKGGYTFFWKGKATDEPRIHRVGFAIKNQLISQLSELPVGISERLMTLRLVLANNQTATVLSAYAPTLISDEDKKEAFYACLDEVLSKIPKEDKIIILGDFNARVGRDHHLWKGTIGKEGIGNINSNGVLLLSKCAQYDLIITNNIFRQKNKLKGSWRHPRSKQWHLIDYVIVRARDQHDVSITKAMTDSEAWTDHRLIRSTMSIRLKRKRRLQKKLSRQRLNLETLNKTAALQLFQASLGESLNQEYPEDIEEHWSLLKSSIFDTCSAILGYKARKHQDWFDENDRDRTAHLQEKGNLLCLAK